MTTTSRRYRSDALRSIHLAMQGVHKVGGIDKATMREFDVACLTQVELLEPGKIRQIREAARMSQAVFAQALNVGVSLVSQWERGERKPSGPSLKLLSLADQKGIDVIL
jgi:putative transcriptional regulator